MNKTPGNMLKLRTLFQTHLTTFLNSTITSNPTAKTRYFSTSKNKTGIVMSFGDNSHGALGLPASLTGLRADVYEPTRVPGLPSDVVGVSCGHYHSLVVTYGGEVWSWGRNNEGQLGRDASRAIWNEPKRVEGLNHVHVLSTFASGVISAAVGDDGTLWVWGKSKRGQLGLGKGVTQALVPSKVEALEGEKIAKVSFGWGHALAQTEDGKLFGWGYSADGRLGNVGGAVESSPLESDTDQLVGSMEAAERLVLEGMEKEKDMPIVWDPFLVEELHGVEVEDVACGLDHSLVLCRDGSLLSGGANVYGQLGRESQEIGLFPVDISTPPLSIASGLGHSFAILPASSTSAEQNATKVVSWGWNQSSQLGRSGPENVPLEVEGLAEENVVFVSGGRAHSVALTPKGEVLVWGCGRSGRLGLGSSCDEPEPMFLDSFEGFEVIQVAVGFDHNLVLVA